MLSGSSSSASGRGTTISLFIAPSILTEPVRRRAAVSAGVSLAPRFDPSGFALVEVGHIPDLGGSECISQPGLDCGIWARCSFCPPCGVTSWMAPAGASGFCSVITELLARATVAGFFGLRVAGWQGATAAEYDASVVDELAGLVPSEGGFREDLVRAWFVISGLPFVTHVLAVPPEAVAEDVAAVGELIQGITFADAAYVAELAARVGAPADDVAAMLRSVETGLTVEDRPGQSLSSLPAPGWAAGSASFPG